MWARAPARSAPLPVSRQIQRLERGDRSAVEAGVTLRVMRLVEDILEMGSGGTAAAAFLCWPRRLAGRRGRRILSHPTRAD